MSFHRGEKSVKENWIKLPDLDSFHFLKIEEDNYVQMKEEREKFLNNAPWIMAQWANNSFATNMGPISKK